MWHIKLLHIETYNPACLSLLINSGHIPKTRSVQPCSLGLYVMIQNAYIAVLPAERHSPWAACLQAPHSYNLNSQRCYLLISINGMLHMVSVLTLSVTKLFTQAQEFVASNTSVLCKRIYELESERSKRCSKCRKHGMQNRAPSMKWNYQIRWGIVIRLLWRWWADCWRQTDEELSATSDAEHSAISRKKNKNMRMTCTEEALHSPYYIAETLMCSHQLLSVQQQSYFVL